MNIIMKTLVSRTHSRTKTFVLYNKEFKYIHSLHSKSFDTEFLYWKHPLDLKVSLDNPNVSGDSKSLYAFMFAEFDNKGSIETSKHNGLQTRARGGRYRHVPNE